jgi:hypothetical protein
MKRSGVVVSVLAMTAIAAPAAHGATLTLGSTLAASATTTQSHQADTTFWPATIGGASYKAPENGQVVSIRVKGTAIQPAGAPAPVNMIHFQALEPQADGTMKVDLTSAAFYLPYTGNPDQITGFKPQNLCLHKGDVVGFNDEGGWDGTGTGPYAGGAPFRIFGSASDSSTRWYSRDNGTKNGAVLAPSALLDGTELLLQYTMVTGDDRSYECGGPLRDPNGNAIARMRVTPKQDLYVSSDGSFTVFGYCGDARADCAGGKATVTYKGKPIASGAFSTKSQGSIRIPLKLSTADFARLSALPGSRWTATLTLTTPGQGTVSSTIAMHSRGGAMHVVKGQKVYVRGNRRLSPAGFCGVATGCAGMATLTVKGNVVAAARFATKSRGKITISLRVPARIYRQLKRNPLAALLAIAGPLGADSVPVLLRH